MSDQGQEGYTPAPPKDKAATRAPSKFETEQAFAGLFFNRITPLAANTGQEFVLLTHELVDRGHPARQVMTQQGTFLVTVKWLGPQTLKG